MNESGPVVFVVDDDPSYLKSVGRLLRGAGYRVETFASAADLLKGLPAGASGCVLTDLRMPERSGLDLQDALVRSASPLPVVFISASGDVPSAARALKRGAVDFLTKLGPKEELLEAVEHGLARDAREREARATLGESRGLYETLTPKEREVLAHVLQGRLNKQIAGRLGIQERTVKLHRTSVTRKLGISSVAGLTRWAQTSGLLAELDLLASTFPKGR